MLELKMHEAKMMRNQGHKICQIAEALGKSERTIHNYLSQETRERVKRAYPSKLDAFKPYIDIILDEDPYFNREKLLEKLRKLQYEGGISILRDYAAFKANEINTKAIYRFETEPGYQAQVDWKVLNTQNVNGKKRKLYAFEMVFGFSRAPFVVHTTSMDEYTLLACHVMAFEYFGGVPQEILYDNMKTAFIYSHVERKWKPNKHLLALASHYGFMPRRCRIRRPQTKGKVERFIQYYEGNFWIDHRGKELNMDELNEAVLRWIAKINIKPVQGLNESRQERFNHEKKYLLPLPPKPFDCRITEKVKVSGESLVRVRNNWYSVPVQYIGKELSLKVDSVKQEAVVYTNNEVVRSFQIHADVKNQRFYEKGHKEKLFDLWLLQQKPKRKPRDIPDPEVYVRTPSKYEQLFAAQEAPV